MRCLGSKLIYLYHYPLCPEHEGTKEGKGKERAGALHSGLLWREAILHVYSCLSYFETDGMIMMGSGRYGVHGTLLAKRFLLMIELQGVRSCGNNFPSSLDFLLDSRFEFVETELT